MVSDARLELLVEDAENRREAALDRLEDGDRESAAECLREAAELHIRVASKAEFSETEEQHLRQAQALKSKAARLENPERERSSGQAATDSADGEAPADHGGESVVQPEDSWKFFGQPPDRSLADVGGMDELKQRLRRDVHLPLEKPEFYEKQGSGIENGVLLYGPPGTGKSWLAKCFAGELGWNYAEIHASDIVSKYVGESAKNLNQLFEEAEAASPAALFIDELDALAVERGSGMGETRSERQAVNELLQWMQEVQGSDVLVIGATNRREELDAAITRSERFNQEFFVGPPDEAARKQILGVQLNQGCRAVDWQSIEWARLVAWTQGFSAADLSAVVRKAARLSAEESTEEGELVPINYRHLLEAVKTVEPSLEEVE